MCEFSDFTITHILRENIFGDSRSAKSAILTHLEALNFDLYEFCTFRRLNLTNLTKIIAPNIVKTAMSRTSRFSKIDFT